MLFVGNAKKIPLREESVNCCITSPPYYGLRDYGTATWHGGDKDCDHVEREIRTGLGLAEFSAKLKGGGHKAGKINKIQYTNKCDKCGATRSDLQIGLEPSIEDYVVNILWAFREIWRVLREDGTVWLNLGDSYSGSGKGGNGPLTSKNWKPAYTKKGFVPAGTKPKDLLGIPWRVALALQSDGWYIRSDIIWHKPNPMPESVKDRPTKSHEYIFLLSKGPKYYYDAEAIKESSVTDGADRRNKRTVWTVATTPYKEAHFAVFPPKLIEPMIIAGCPPGGLVLDPFVGSGTTCEVARSLGRRSVGIDLSLAFLKLAERRMWESHLPLLDK